MKLVLALWRADQQALLGEHLRQSLRGAGATRLKVNLDVVPTSRFTFDLGNP